MIELSRSSVMLFEMSFEEAMIAAGALLTAALATLWTYRSRLYRTLGERQQSIRDAGFTGTTTIAERNLPPFDERLAVIQNPLPPDQFERLSAEINSLQTTERNYVPTHKKGGTIAYETLCTKAPSVVAYYLSPELHDLLSRVVGVKVQPTPLHDQSSCSILFYERPGDHIGWHYDHNFYRGRHFTVLVPIVNRNADGSGLSAARLFTKIGKEERQIPTPPNSLVVFEGAKVIHKATPIAEGERRVVLSMTFCTDPRNTLIQGIARRIKDTAFFGIRALWT
ncbi:MAG: hypothetical protein AB7O43_16690 [Hyphomicrobiaceae bacterium]